MCSSIANGSTFQVLLDDLQDPQLSKYRLDLPEYSFYPFAQLYTMYWGKGNRYLKHAKPFIPLPLKLIPGDKLYCFGQYSYMEQRIDAFREYHRITSGGSGIPPGLALIGSPGIGELVLSHLFKNLNNFSGKTSFLLYYLVREFAHAQPTAFFIHPLFYVFTEEGVHIMRKLPRFGSAWKFMTCLVDADPLHPPPSYLMMESGLFVLAVSSTGLDHHYWVKQRSMSQQFALNPPTQDELVQVLVWSFIPFALYSRSLVSLI